MINKWHYAESMQAPIRFGGYASTKEQGACRNTQALKFRCQVINASTAPNLTETQLTACTLGVERGRYLLLDLYADTLEHNIRPTLAPHSSPSPVLKLPRGVTFSPALSPSTIMCSTDACPFCISLACSNHFSHHPDLLIPAALSNLGHEAQPQVTRRPPCTARLTGLLD